MFGWFSDEDDNEYDCGHHHFGEWREKNRWKTDRRCLTAIRHKLNNKFIVEEGAYAINKNEEEVIEDVWFTVLRRLEKKSCKHERCLEAKEKWVDTYVLEDGNLTDYEKYKEDFIENARNGVSSDNDEE